MQTVNHTSKAGKSESTGNEAQKGQGVDVASGLEGEPNTTSFMRNTMVSSTMVSGEASETDDEDEENEENPGNMKEDEDLATEDKHLKEEGDADTDILESEQDTSAGKAKRQKIVYKFDSDLVEGLTKSYKSAGSKLESSTFHLSRAQTAALDVSHNTRMMLEDLTTISTLLESILGTGKLLPLKVTVNYK
ncbi:hypothetical protein pdam_00002050 [Pocillopora damicornis]|uniref:Biogenesis of lysosome-related organelles complex 1 subunit 3 n=1 Tax=Pocillopora damicornis TaxID=46731 RepID=A0A3M6TX95_POCDA|nr:hypothetical protein pdam_00002050 [Pocillopora damicornis]